MSELSLLTGGGDSVAWGVAAARVRAVLDGQDPAGAGALDVAAVVGGGGEEDGGRVLVLETGRGPLPLRVRGRLELRSVDGEQVLALPHQLLPEAVELFSGVLFQEDREPLLLLDVERLAERGMR